eukprot:CAMPEP_0168622804 /NCGR_PEP_ID=MMETSP0449_2-20121227/8476_1 /TAXON_ID=1082188 /ORGANISM="Strombidium rassoulzadegani, Strain ras09" /LENGTH=184 /DNA_ID=CAMNT_0008664121 /DNA_START=201 /DNA_END=755 /DNA_ORIENTATION=-
MVGELVVEVEVEAAVRLGGPGTLVLDARSEQEEVGGLDLLKETHGLAGIDHHEHLLVAVLEVHLVEDLGEVLGLEHLRILDLEEVVAPVPVEEHEDLRLRVGLQLFVLGEIGGVPASEQVEDGLESEVLLLVVDLDVVAVEVVEVVSFSVDGRLVNVARIAGVVLGQHEYNVVILDPHPLQVLV